MRRDAIPPVRALGGLTLTVLMLFVGACRPEAAPVEATTPVAPGARAGGDPMVAGGVASVTPDDEVYLGSFGLLAPTMPGLALGKYATACDPIGDPFESCL